MYMHDGKPIQVPYGRRNVNVTKLELEDIVAALVARIEALEVALAELKPATSEEVIPVVEEQAVEPVVEQVEDEQTEEVVQEQDGGQQDEPASEGYPPKPRRGRKPKEAQE